MFSFNSHKPIIKDFPLIRDNYVELITEDVPVLFYGTNAYKNILLGSIMLEDEEQLLYRYLHVIVSHETLFRFLNHEISYRSILENSDFIFVITRGYDEKIIDVNMINFNDIPELYRPKVDSFCPSVPHITGFNYEIIMNGGLSDLHQILPKDGNDVQLNFADALQGAFNTLKGIDVVPIVYQRPSMTGSFKLNFHVELKENSQRQASLFPLETKNVAAYLGNYLSFVLKKIPEAPSSTIETAIKTSNDVVALESELSEIYVQNNAPIPQNVTEILTHNLKLSTERFLDMSEQIGDSFTSIGITNISEYNTGEQVIGLITKDFQDKLQIKAKTEQELIAIEQQVEELKDDLPKKYNINIFHFNAKTGSGEANILEDDKVYQVSLKVKSKQSLFGSIYTQSLHEEVRIDVMAIATKVNGKYKALLIQI